MKLSLIIPVYNTSKYLRKCLDSVINQTYQNLEIICINDGSSDDSLDILNEYAEKDKRMKVIDKKNEGVSATRNMGLNIASGDLIAFVDSDDAIVPDMYEIMIKNMIKFDALMSVCDVYRIRENKIYDYGKNDLETFLVEDPISDFLLDLNLQYVIANKVFKKSLIGKIRFSEELANSEDRLFLYEIYKKKPKVVKYNAPKYIYYLNSESASGRPFSLKNKSILKSADIICNDVLESYPDIAKEADKYMFENLIIFIRKLALSPNKNEYIDYYNNVRHQIIVMSKKIEISKKRKLEVLILKNFNFLYRFFVKKVTTRCPRIDMSKVKDDLFLE